LLALIHTTVDLTVLLTSNVITTSVMLSKN